MLDIAAIKQAASGRWPEIISRVCGVPLELLDGKHHPCPQCGGKDRFRLMDRRDGAVICNQCFSEKNGDGVAAVMWLTGQSFSDATAAIARELGMDCERTQTNVVDEMAWRKGVPSWALRAFGAEIATRGKLQVCRVPMFDCDMNEVGHFDLAPLDGFDKGKMLQGSKHGLFIAGEPPKDTTPVAIVEGVKDAAALHAIGIQAVGLPTCRMAVEFARFFRDLDVIVIPDRDKAGIEGAEETASRLHGVAASVKIAQLPAEYRETGGMDTRDVLRTADGEKKIRDAIAHATAWRPKAGHRIVLKSLAVEVEKLIESQGECVPLITLGLPGVDHAIGGGVLRGEMVIVAGRPGHGKTMAGMQAIDHLSTQVSTLVISEEMSVVALAQRALSGVSPIAVSEWPNRKLDLLGQAASHYSGRNEIAIVESCGTVGQATEAIAMAKEQHGIGVVMVDYVQLLKGDGTGRYEQVSDASMKLKQAAIRYDVVLLGLCQLSRGIESRNSTTPKMSDLRDSGQLEQDADVIVFVEWMRRSSPDGHLEGEYRFYVAKNRNRPIVKTLVDCVFKPERQRLYPKAKQPEPEPSRFGEFDGFGGGSYEREF